MIASNIVKLQSSRAALLDRAEPAAGVARVGVEEERPEERIGLCDAMQHDHSQGEPGLLI